MKTKNTILLNRSILTWGWYKDTNTARLFIHLLLRVNYEDNYINGILIKRGQVLTSIDSLRYETGMTIQQIRTCISKLTKTGEITSKSTNKYRIVTVLKYDDYQYTNKQTNKQDNKPITNTATTNNQLNQNNQLNPSNLKKQTKKFSKPSIDEIKNYCKERKNNVDASRFFDYYESKGWKVGKNNMKDWKAAIRTWEQNTYQQKNKETFKPEWLDNVMNDL